MSDLYRDYIHANFGPDDFEYEMPFCRNEGCESDDRLPVEPAGMQKVRDRILTWEEIKDEAGNVIYRIPDEYSWVDEPFWKCPTCGTEYSLDEVNR